MSDDPVRSEQAFTPEVAQRLLARAAQLDAGSTGALSVAQLCEIATEAAIGPAAMESALREYATAKKPVPVWVRATLSGVPDRPTALRFYWIFVAGICASPLLTRLNVRPLTGGLLSLGVASFCLAALWGTSRAVAWFDRHGWQLRP